MSDVCSDGDIARRVTPGSGECSRCVSKRAYTDRVDSTRVDASRVDCVMVGFVMVD